MTYFVCHKKIPTKCSCHSKIFKNFCYDGKFNFSVVCDLILNREKDWIVFFVCEFSGFACVASNEKFKSRRQVFITCESKNSEQTPDFDRFNLNPAQNRVFYMRKKNYFSVDSFESCFGFLMWKRCLILLFSFNIRINVSTYTTFFFLAGK